MANVNGYRAAIRVLVADGQPLYRDAVARTFRQDPAFQLVGEAPDGRAALAAIARLRPDVAVLDLGLPLLDGERVLRAVARDGLGSRVILLAVTLTAEEAYRATGAGAAACLTKDVDATELRAAAAAVADGGAVFSPVAMRGIANAIQIRAQGRDPALSDRERAILHRIAAGESTPEIAVALHVSVATVKTHLGHLYAKLGVAERAAAVANAMRLGVLD